MLLRSWKTKMKLRLRSNTSADDGTLSITESVRDVTVTLANISGLSRFSGFARRIRTRITLLSGSRAL